MDRMPTELTRVRSTEPRRPVVPRRHPRTRRIARGLVTGLAALVLAGVLGAAAEAWVSRSDGDRYPAPGRLLTVAGNDLHLHCTGTGSPTVVLEAGLGEGSLTWAGIQPVLDDDLRVCSYDRAGQGWSDGGDGDWTAEKSAADLMALLTAAGESGPYILVAHSVGALVAREFRQSDPRAVVAMVLLEPTDEESVRKAGVPAVAVFERHVYGLLSRTGALRWLGEWLVPNVLGAQPPDELLRRLPVAYSSRALATSMHELRGTVVSAQHLLQEEDPAWGDLPVTVLSAATSTEETRAAHMVLADRSSSGAHVVAPDSGHYVHYTDPDLVIRLVRDAAGIAN